MPKRKEKSDDEDAASDVSLVDVDFEFFDPNPTDYAAFKRLLTQLFQSDAGLFHLHELSDLILSQPLLGTTVKTDGRESDPYAFLTVLNCQVHKEHPSIKALIAYALQKAASNPEMYSTLQSLLGPEGLESDQHVGLLLGERLINMPVQVVPPMYRMLSDEIQWANDENEPYKFTHYLIFSRIYRLSAEEATAMELDEVGPPNKKQKNKRKGPPKPQQGGTFGFHPEDEQIQQVALFTLDYDFTNRQPRDSESFGLDTAGRLMLIPASRFQELTALMSEVYAVPS